MPLWHGPLARAMMGTRKFLHKLNLGKPYRLRSGAA